MSSAPLASGTGLLGSKEGGITRLEPLVLWRGENFVRGAMQAGRNGDVHVCLDYVTATLAFTFVMGHLTEATGWAQLARPGITSLAK